jgi:hypothetical protein
MWQVTDPGTASPDWWTQRSAKLAEAKGIWEPVGLSIAQSDQGLLPMGFLCCATHLQLQGRCLHMLVRQVHMVGPGLELVMLRSLRSLVQSIV